MLLRFVNVGASVAASVVRLGFGSQIGPLGARPALPLRLYEFEGCPFCRKVREVLSVLDLDAEIYPCPKGGPRFRREIAARGGKQQFPYLVDENAGVELYESSAIVEHLYDRYGGGARPPAAARFPANATVFLVGALRLTAGTIYRRSKTPDRPLELYSYEASPFCRLVREHLSELELPYVLHNVARGSDKRAAFEARAGKVMVPFLVDPNGGVEMFESADIVAYLEERYAIV